MAASSLVFTFDWQADEHMKVVRMLTHEVFASGIGRVFKWILIAVSVFATLVVIVEFAVGDTASALGLLPWVLLLLFWLIFAVRLMAFVNMRQVRRNDPNIGHSFRHELGESALHISAKTTDLDLKWTGMEKVQETSDLFLFYYSRRCAYFLPKRAIGDDAAVAKVRRWIKDHLPETVAYLGPDPAV